MKKIAIIGAGLAGLTTASFLREFVHLDIFEKSRGVGGRLSTRRAEPYYFDHGAQYFTVKTQEFQAFLKPLIDYGVIAPWQARQAAIKDNKIVSIQNWSLETPHYVGVPGINAIGKYFAQNLNVHKGIRVSRISKSNHQWRLYSDDNQDLGLYDWVVFATPVAQTLEILPDGFKEMGNLQSIEMQACFSLMLGFETPLALDYDCARVLDSDIRWIAVNSTKPGREGKFSLLVQSSNDWADQHIDDDRGGVLEYLLQRTSEIIGYDVAECQHKALHGWRYAYAHRQGGQTHYIDVDNRLSVCGDWCIEGRVEAAFTSGYMLSNDILRIL